jgi:hypothetical protein
MKPAISREKGQQAFVVIMADGESARVNFASNLSPDDLLAPIRPRGPVIRLLRSSWRAPSTRSVVIVRSGRRTVSDHAEAGFL